MKKLTVLLTALLLITALSPAALFAAPTEEDAVNAFSVSFQVYIYCAMMMAFGVPMEGAILSNNDLILDNFNLNQIEDMETEGYTTISGKVTATQNSGQDVTSIAADVTLKGGAVSKLKWTIADFDIESENWEVKIDADGTKYTYSD